MKRLLFIYNLHSGKGLIRNHLADIIDTFNKAGYETVVYSTQERADATRLAKELGASYDLVVCSGGDGTLSEVLDGVMTIDEKRRPKIGYIPAGSTNDYAYSLGLPSQMKRCANVIAEEKFRAVDVGKFQENSYFVYVAAFGAFTEVSYATPQHLKNLLGHQAYVLEGVKSLAALKPYKVKVTSNELQVEDSFVYGMVSNTESVGGMRGLAGTGVDLQDGLFEVTLIKEIKNPMEVQQLVTAFLSKNFEKCDVLYSFKTSKITFESEEAIKWTLDGEYGGEWKEMRLEVEPRAIEFIIKKRKEKTKKLN